MTSASPTLTSPSPQYQKYMSRIAVVVLVTIGVALVLMHSAYRSAEIRLAAVLIDLVTSSGVEVVPGRQTVYFGLGTGHAIGLRITPECTSAFLVVPLLVVAAAMLGLRPSITRRVLASLGIAVVVLILVNQVRMLTLVWLISSFGRERGYYLGHTLFGSMVSVFGGAAALVLFVWLSTRTPRGTRHRPGAMAP